MANTFFRMKQFTVEQDLCAMKVCTDACLFGAWVAHWLSAKEPIGSILDIGAGTGLLSMMLAQKTAASIHAIELDTNAALQASQNFAASPWPQRLSVQQENILAFHPAAPFDFIISNPPFFENDLKSIATNRNMAMHSSSLRLDELLQWISRHLSATGYAAILVPYHRSAYTLDLILKNEMHPCHIMHVRQSVQHDFFRSQFIFSKQQHPCHTDSMAIQTEQKQYSPEATALLKDYYLYL